MHEVLFIGHCYKYGDGKKKLRGRIRQIQRRSNLVKSVLHGRRTVMPMLVTLMCNLFTAEGKKRISLDCDVLVRTCVIIRSEVGRFGCKHEFRSSYAGEKLKRTVMQRAEGMRRWWMCKDVVHHYWHSEYSKPSLIRLSNNRDRNKKNAVHSWVRRTLKIKWQMSQ
jgi:hypothetical protein